MKEIWKDIKGYEGLYQISNLGNVKKLINNKYMAISKDLGYETVKLTNKNGNRRHLFLHRIIADVFIPNPNNYKIVNHIDCNKFNNNIKNLEWCTQKENVKHAWKNNLCERTKKACAKNGKNNSKKIIQLDKNKNIVKVWESTMEIERTLKIKHNNISFCCKNKERTAKGYYWEYYNQDVSNSKEGSDENDNKRRY